MAFFSKAGNILRQTVSKHVSSEIYGSNPSVFQLIRFMSSSKVFVGGLSYNTDEMSLTEAFNKYGEVIEARVILDRETGRSRGFGFVTYTSDEEASAAIQALDGQDLHGRRVKVNYANERPPRAGGFGGGGYGGGGYGGGYGASSFGGGGGGNYGGSGGYGGADNSGGGSSYGNYGGGGGYGGNHYGSGGISDSYGGGNYAQGGTYASGTNYDSGSSGNYSGGNQGFSVAGGGGGSDNYVSADAGANTSFASSGYDGSSGLGFSGDQFGSKKSTDTADASGGFGQDDPVEENFRDDDDETDDYANRKA
ncbi:glycine-rich RNA-binding protein 3 [Actinidia rufa]|uniref:Glycine-rich RNA-binding protein 3 n=1 Tax=Actinidia rufa TaxID=165716 RepID=A0A7J0GMW4_9ERIC|nr:glycine-rich RNA-binding protein 3 [Actinidia rufa]